jgi:type II secretory ATPase GspE/PulE/Tfp pilus assembly ATPase PilB-like protein
MSRRLLVLLLSGVAVALLSGDVAAQTWPDFPLNEDDPHAFDRGPGGYLAWWKLLLLALTFLVWVPLANWMNVDAQRHGARTRIAAPLWNPIVVGAALLGFMVALNLPIFWIGWPMLLLSTLGPFVTYVVLRNSRMPAHQTIFTGGHLSRTLKRETQLVQPGTDEDEGPPIQLEASGNPQQVQVNQIRARQFASPLVMKSLFYDAVASRADMLVALRNPSGVQWRKRIDGVWHGLPAMDREIGDGVVTSLKYLSNIDPSDPGASPAGFFTVRTLLRPLRCELRVNVESPGETLNLRLLEAKKPNLTLAELGMFPDNEENLKQALNSPGLVIVSAFPGGGLTTTWHSVLLAADRVTRDWVGIVDQDELETRVENIELYRYDPKRGQRPTEILRSILLKQPEALVVPVIPDAELMDSLTQQVLKDKRTVVTRCVARSSAEALLRTLSIAGQRRDLIQAVTAVTGQRLARRLCDQCKQPMPVTPELLKQLGADLANPPVIYKQYAKPDPPPVDKKGRPIELEPCKRCAGFGYYGRVGLMELVMVDDPIRAALSQQPDVATITNVALNKRHQSALQQGYRHILAGTTSTAEIHRVFKEAE